MPWFQPFVMERMMSKFEKAVDYNLSESGVHPLTLNELFQDDPEGMARLMSLEMDYAHANGIPGARNIAHPGAGPENARDRGHRGQLRHPSGACFTRRRDRRHAAQLHADLGAGQEPGFSPQNLSLDEKTAGRPTSTA